VRAEAVSMRYRVLGFAAFLFLAVPARADVIMAGPALAACSGISGNAQPMHAQPLTSAACMKLPGAALYNQAGGAFQSGDHKRAAALALQAAQAGNPLAQLRLAMLYEAGDGVARSTKAAFTWYSQAAAQGEPAAQMELGGYYEEGDTVAENWDLAVRLYQASAMQGWVKGQFALGRAYEFGIGVPQNRANAMLWFQRAGAQGDAKGSYFAKWLRDPTNNVGFRNDMEHDLVIGAKLRFAIALMGGDPAGITFHNSAQRILWLEGLRNQVNAQEAAVFADIRKREYDDCRRAGRDNCLTP
jgi:uncharacterized protein